MLVDRTSHKLKAKWIEMRFVSLDQWPTSFRDPQYISTLVGILAIGALAFYAAVVDSAPSIETVFCSSWGDSPYDGGL